MRPDIRVIKVGGSLWDWPGLVPNLREWLQQSKPGPYLIVVGGGAAVESVRKKQAAWHMTEDAAHWMALRLMSCHAQAAAGLLHAFGPLESITALENAIQREAAADWSTKQQLYVISMEGILQQQVRAVEASWEVTSDSLAAWLAQRIRAFELIVLKSSSPHEADVQEDYFDPQFARYVGGIPQVRVVNLRLPGWPSWTLRGRADGTVACTSCI